MPDTSTTNTFAGPLPPSLAAVLFRRAASTLHAQVAAMPAPWGDRPWRVVQTDPGSTEIDGLAVCDQPHGDHSTSADRCCWATEPVGHEAVAAYARTMQPAVGLSLARLLESHAERLAAAARAGATEVLAGEHLIDIARAIVGDRHA